MDLSFFIDNNILDSGNRFFKEVLNINITPAVRSALDLKEFLQGFLSDEKLLDKVSNARLIGMVNDLSLQEKNQEKSADEILQKDNDDYDMILVFGVELAEDIYPTRTDISRLTRALNRRSASRPVVLLTRYSDKLTFSAAERGQYKREGQKGEKVGRISMLRDIDLKMNNIHSGHERILLQLRINPLKIISYKELYNQWLEVFNISILNKEFYNELFIWYLWAVKTVSFPNKISDKSDDTVYNSENVIRLLTRLIFIWFVKEKNLIPELLFDKEYLSGIIKKFNPVSDTNSDYYKSILQNLFFATLNTEMPKDGGIRKFIDETRKNKKTGYSDEYMDHLSYRYKDLFNDPVKALCLFEQIPFLNGGLFECLDQRNPETDEEIRIDGFSSKPSKQPNVPNILFFGTNNDLDLSSEFEDGKKHKHSKARGIINILNSYKFTIEENTPLEQEIALDPELLGKIFENLLASYNPETRTTARKQTGSYYTPREIVNYMVDESLIAYLKNKLTEQPVSYQPLGSPQTNFLGNDYKAGQLEMQVELAYNKWKEKEEELNVKLHELFSYENEENPFISDKESSDSIIAHLSECKILDPACGSGAFPMGILHKIVLALGKLDPCNYSWKQAQLDKAVRDRQRAEEFEDEALKNDAIKRAEEKIRYIEESFGDTGHELDYARKLFLIENCIYGVDIQQVAVQISKLRFFISLMVDQKVNDKKRNRNILSLPNLETKFVAANTLIPIEKPQQLSLKDPEVENYEKKLKEIHHKIFYTRGYAEKKKLKKEELDTRKHLRKLYIEKAGYKKEAAEAITKWNPFDPLIAAPFFDPVVMFTIEKENLGGYFDLIIGNPPWGATFTKDEKDKLKHIYPDIDSSTPNSFSYFIGFAKKNRIWVYSFVLPDSFLIKDYGKTRKLIKDELIILHWYQNIGVPEKMRPFIYVEHDVILFIAKKGPSKDLFVHKYSYLRGNEHLTIEINLFDKSLIIRDEFDSAYNITLKDKDLDILNKINRFPIIESYMECHEGIHTGNIREKLFLIEKSNEFCKPLFYGAGAGDIIDSYLSKMKGWHVDYRSELIEKSKGEYASLREERIFKYEKIFITRTGKPFKAFFDENNYASNNFFSMQYKNIELNNKTNLFYTLAFLNSKVCQYFIRKYASPRVGELFIETKIIHLLKFHIPEVNSQIKDLIVKIVSQIINNKFFNKPVENIETHLDLIVNKLYNFTFEECKIIDPQIEKLISRYDYESMSIEELAEYEIKE